MVLSVTMMLSVTMTEAVCDASAEKGEQQTTGLGSATKQAGH